MKSQDYNLQQPAPKVSVIVPNYNYARFLEKRLDSVLNQTFTDFEVILLDDASTDNSAEVLRRYAAADPRVTHLVINDQNSGGTFRQWERGIKLARGQYIWIAEADDMADPRFLEHTVAALDADPKVTLAYTMSHQIDPEGREIHLHDFDDCAPDGTTAVFDGSRFAGLRMADANRVYNASMVLFRRDRWLSVPTSHYVNMKYVGDWMMWIEMMERARIAQVQLPLNYFRLHGHSVTDRAATDPRAQREMWQIKFYLLQTPGMMSYDARHMMRYQLNKHVTHGKTDWARKLRELLPPDYEKRLGVTRANYPWLWVYKHWLHSPWRAVERSVLHVDRLEPLYTL